MPFGFDDRFTAEPGPLDPRFQPTMVTATVPQVAAPTFLMMGVANITTYRTELASISISTTESANLSAITHSNIFNINVY